LTEPAWVQLAAVFQFHSHSIAEFGGSPGVRDQGAIESALDRPKNLFAYGQPDLLDLAATPPNNSMIVLSMCNKLSRSIFRITGCEIRSIAHPYAQR